MEVDSHKRSDYLLLIQARLYGWSGSNADKLEMLELPTYSKKSNVPHIRLAFSDLFLHQAHQPQDRTAQ